MTYATPHKHTSLPEAVSGPSPPVSPGGPTTDLFGRPLAPVSRSRKPASGPELLMSGICGPTYIESSPDMSEPPGDVLQSWENRLRERLATIGSTESALIWRSKDTGHGWSISRLAPWTPPTSASGSTGSLWPIPTSSVGGPMADAASPRLFPAAHAGIHREAQGERARHGEPERCDGALGHTLVPRLEGHSGHGHGTRGRPLADRPVTAPDGSDVEHATGVGRGEGRPEYELRGGRATAAGADAQIDVADADQPFGRFGDQQSARQFAVDEQDAGIRIRPGSRNGSFWSDAEWIACHDGKARRAQSSLRLLVDGFPGRVDIWRIAGNAIVPQLAAEVLRALMDVTE